MSHLGSGLGDWWNGNTYDQEKGCFYPVQKYIKLKHSNTCVPQAPCAAVHAEQCGFCRRLLAVLLCNLQHEPEVYRMVKNRGLHTLSFERPCQRDQPLPSSKGCHTNHTLNLLLRLLKDGHLRLAGSTSTRATTDGAPTGHCPSTAKNTDCPPSSNLSSYVNSKVRFSLSKPVDAPWLRPFP